MSLPGRIDRAKDDPLTHGIIGCGIKVHRALGCGLLEAVYQECLCYELAKSGFEIARQKALPVIYDGQRLELGFRPDVVVNGQVIVEIKTVTMLLPIHDAQLLSYLRLSGIERGLLMNFHAQPLVSGIRRLILSTPDSAVS